MRDATRVVRAGHGEAIQGEPFLPGPTFASVYHLAGDPTDSPHRYGRFENPTWTRFERALEALEGGPTVCFSSGMAATVATLESVLEAGDVLVMPSDGYFGIRAIAEDQSRRTGVEIRWFETRGDPGRLLDGAKLLWLETPSNPGLDACDVTALSLEAQGQGVLVAVDNTTPTVLGQAPLELGADFSVASDTKALAGHGDLVLGHVACRHADWADRLREWRRTRGSVPGPMEVWLAHRSLGSLDVRLERMCSNAQTVAEFLAGRPEVRRVRYPGLADDPSHAIAVRQMKRFGPVVSFTVDGRDMAEALLDECRLVSEATSFGGLHTTAERRGRWEGDAVPDGFIRLSLGCEHSDDLIEDIGRALHAATSRLEGGS